MKYEVRVTETGQLLGVLRTPTQIPRNESFSFSVMKQIPTKYALFDDEAMPLPVYTVRFLSQPLMYSPDGRQRLELPTLYVREAERRHVAKIKGFRRV